MPTHNPWPPERVGRRVGPWLDYVPPHDWGWAATRLGNGALATGAMPLTRREVTYLVDGGITHIVTVCTEAPLTVQEVLATDSRVTHLLNAEPDDGRWKEPIWFDRTLDFALPALEAGANVFVHCVLGSNRGPAHAYAILRASGWTAAEAEEAVRAARPGARILYLPDAEEAIQKRNDSNRYRVLAVAVPVAEWVASRLRAVIEGEQ